MMELLRDKIAAILGEFYNFGPEANPVVADPAINAILAIPEIRDALDWWRVFQHSEPMEIMTTRGQRKGLILPPQ